jgi:hypothetical protein
MTDEDPEEEAFRDDMAAFRARLPPEAFEPIAVALGKSTVPQSLNAVREWLLPEFYFFFINCPGEEPSREERIRQLEELQRATTALLKSVRITGGLTRTLCEAADGAERGDDYKAAVRRLADEADEKIQRLRLSRGRAGRPPKDAFWQLAADLVRVYERLTGKEAKKPQWKGGSKYGGDFYDFVIAVDRCLRAALPQVQDELLVVSPGAIGDGLRKKWTAIRKIAGEKLLRSETQ